MDIRATIIEFKQYLKARDYSEKTIEGYGKGLDLFAAYLQEEKIEDLRKVSREVMAAYQEKVQAQPIAMESKALKIRPIKRLFEYLVERNLLLINPTEGMIETCRRNRKIGPVLTMEEMQALLNQPNLSLKTDIRDRAILEVFYSTAIRLDELINLEVYHAELKDQVLYIRKAKGRKQRVVPLGKSASKYLREYLEKIRPYYARKNPKERRLFINHSGLAMTPEAIRQILRKHRIDAGIKKPVSPHTLRRTCATHLVQQGADIRYVQELLGHSRLSTTQIYTKVMPKEVKQMHETYHPGKALPVLSGACPEQGQRVEG
jgi:integrase/recombinase XerD